MRVAFDVPDENWKFSEADIAERNFRDDYLQAYGQWPCPVRDQYGGVALIHRTGRRQGQRAADRVADRARPAGRSEVALPGGHAARRQELKTIHKHWRSELVQSLIDFLSLTQTESQAEVARRSPLMFCRADS